MSTPATPPSVDRSGGPPARPLHLRQLDEEMVRLQRASSTVHRLGQWLEAFRWLVAGGLAVAGVTAAALGSGKAGVAIAGLIGLVASLTILRRQAGRLCFQGAHIQEQFDTGLFGLDWNDVLADRAEFSLADVERLASKVRRGSPRDKRILDGWYDPTDNLAQPLDALVTQEQNLGWDSRLRRRYAAGIVTLGVLWSCAGFGVALDSDSFSQALLTFFVPSAAAYALGVEVAVGQIRIAATRERVGKLVSRRLDTLADGDLTAATADELQGFSRQVQDQIFATRNSVSRVPELLYRWHRSADEAHFEVANEGRRRRLGCGRPPRTQ